MPLFNLLAEDEDAAPTNFFTLRETRKERLAKASVSMGMLTCCLRTPVPLLPPLVPPLGLRGAGLPEGSHSDSDGNFSLDPCLPQPTMATPLLQRRLANHLRRLPVQIRSEQMNQHKRTKQAAIRNFHGALLSSWVETGPHQWLTRSKRGSVLPNPVEAFFDVQLKHQRSRSFPVIQ